MLHHSVPNSFPLLLLLEESGDSDGDMLDLFARLLLFAQVVKLGHGKLKASMSVLVLLKVALGPGQSSPSNISLSLNLIFFEELLVDWNISSLQIFLDCLVGKCLVSQGSPDIMQILRRRDPHIHLVGRYCVSDLLGDDVFVHAEDILVEVAR